MGRKNVEEIKNDVCRMLEVMQAIHDEASEVLYYKEGNGDSYWYARHAQLIGAMAAIDVLISGAREGL